MLCNVTSEKTKEQIEFENQTVSALKSLITNIGSLSELKEEIQLLLSEHKVAALVHNIKQLEEMEKQLNDSLEELLKDQSENQEEIALAVKQIKEGLLKTVSESLSVLKQQKKHITVVQQLLMKRFSRLGKDASFKDQSFKLALEELLESKLGATQVHKGRNSMMNDTAYKSFKRDQSSIIEYLGDKSFVKNHKIDNKNDNNFPEQLNGFNKILTDRSLLNSEASLPRNQFLPLELENLPRGHIYNIVTKNPSFLKYKISESSAPRNQMPTLADAEFKFNIWNFLKNSIGKDLSKISMPAEINEPMSVLQRVAHVIQFSELLVKANQCEDRYLRVGYVAASLFGTIMHMIRRIRKPFNPLLGETFEYCEGGIRFISEQVSHHPPVASFYAESDDFIIEGFLYAFVKLTLQGINTKPSGDLIITLKKTGEKFSVDRPFIRVYNLIMGKPYLYSHGEMLVTNLTTGDKAKVYYQPKGWSSSKDYQTDGHIIDKNDKVWYTFSGRSDSYLDAQDVNSKRLIQLVEKKPDIPNYERQYNYDIFNVRLNHLTKEMLKVLPFTDTRLRPDMRALEHCDYDLSNGEKTKLEEAQRLRRKEMEKAQQLHKPLWFDIEMGQGNVVSAKYKGGYWEARKSGKWPAEMLNLYDV